MSSSLFPTQPTKAPYTVNQIEQHPITSIIKMASTAQSPCCESLKTSYISPSTNKTPNLPRRSPRSLQRIPPLRLPRLLLQIPLNPPSIVTACLGLIYANHFYQSYILGEFAAYPEPVARHLRRALYYSNHDVQPENAVKYYTKALDLAKEMGIDPLSDEMLGVKFQLASFLEKQIHHPKMAIEVLERVKQHCEAWVEEFGGLEAQREKRTRVLGQMVRMGVKLGDLYARPDVMETEHAEESLVWAVTTLLKEQARREREGVKEGEGDWMGAEEIGGALECPENPLPF
ncbi:MAG: hypothetical protein Q9196_005714 [Gyalolechia fulgens]